MTCLGVLKRGERDNDNETGSNEGEVIEMSTTQCLKEGGVIEMSTTVLHSRCSLLRFVNTYQIVEQHT